MQQRLTYGLSLSPMRAARQKVPRGLEEASVSVPMCVCVSRNKYVPRLVPVEPSWEDTVKVGTGADEEQNDEQKRLEFENAKHCMGV